jgi:hypothetical protein
VESSKKYDLSGVHGAEVFRDLPEGLKLRLASGAIGEIIGNPHDGAILQIRIVEHPDDPSKVGEEEFIFYPDVKEVVESGS